MIKSKIKYAFLCLALLSFGAALIILPERYVNCCFAGFAMWAECVLPSLFPFMVITLLFVKTGIAERASLPLARAMKKIKLPPAAAACLVMGACSGYPAGSRIILEYYESGSLTKSDCRKLNYLCTTSGPLFIIGSVGYKMFGDKILGLKLLCAHLVSVVAVALVICLFSRDKSDAAPKLKGRDENFLYNAFYGAVIAVAVAGGFIAFFYSVSTFFADFKLLYPLERLFSLFVGETRAAALSSGLIEATTGCRALAACGGDKLTAALAGFTITFGGLSILLQQLAYASKTGANALKFVAVKFVQGIVCALILLLIA